ncbi:hypothetical protein, partial [Flavonifractor sp. An306]|uniref:hypothetical protein n=1 Tax=Flavonifractor sp. An306 TaxID=1965629 RepID=UPI00194EB967
RVGVRSQAASLSCGKNQYPHWYTPPPPVMADNKRLSVGTFSFYILPAFLLYCKYPSTKVTSAVTFIFLIDYRRYCLGKRAILHIRVHAIQVG